MHRLLVPNGMDLGAQERPALPRDDPNGRASGQQRARRGRELVVDDGAGRRELRVVDVRGAGASTAITCRCGAGGLVRGSGGGRGMRRGDAARGDAARGCGARAAGTAVRNWFAPTTSRDSLARGDAVRGDAVRGDAVRGEAVRPLTVRIASRPLIDAARAALQR